MTKSPLILRPGIAEAPIYVPGAHGDDTAAIPPAVLSANENPLGCSASALAAWTEIGLSVARAGYRKIVIVNSHGGNLDLVSILSRELRVEAGMLAVKCQWGNFDAPEGMYTDHERQYGIHGGDIETSLMLHLRPDLVRMELVADFPSQQQSYVKEFKHLRGHGKAQ